MWLTHLRAADFGQLYSGNLKLKRAVVDIADVEELLAVGV